jgi:hypothetical protein
VDCLTNRWLVLDTHTMELALSVIPSPVGYWEEHVAVVEAPDGKVGVFAHDFHHPGGKADLHYYTIVQEADSPQWQLEKTIPLPWPAAYHRPFCVRGTANGCLILEVSEEKPAFMASYRVRDAELFKIDVRSFQLEKVAPPASAAGRTSASSHRCPCPLYEQNGGIAEQNYVPAAHRALSLSGLYIHDNISNNFY